MTAKEMFELAKAGYKPTEIAEMHKLMKDADPEIQPKEEPEKQPEEQPKEEPEKQPEEQPKEELDYKKLYEESQKRLEAAQKDNLSKDMSGGQPKDDDILANLVRGFM